MHKPVINLFRYAWYAGSAVIIISIILILSGPHKAVKLPAGFYTPVVAFEFIETRAEVLEMFGASNTPERATLIAAMDRTNKIDFIYMSAYTAFLLLFCASCSGKFRSKRFILNTVIVLTVLASDAVENRQLLAITDKIENPDFSRELTLLHVFTWIKWGGLSTLFLTLVPCFKLHGVFGLIVIITSFFTAFTGLISFFNRSFINEIFAILTAIMFLMLIVFSFINRNRAKI
ncbi:MAG TPA: hypothetical protein PK986_02790 [Spirochaetota bacterium]|nr:hypothetical protein [Spirochaetota bacterium]